MLSSELLTEEEVASALFSIHSYADYRLQLLVITREKLMVYHQRLLHEDSRVVQPLETVSSIIFRQPGALGDGYLQFIIDGVEPRVGGFDSVVKDPYTFAFGTKNGADPSTFSNVVNAYAFVKNFIETARRTSPSSSTVPASSTKEESLSLEHINKLKTISELYTKGHLTQSEFESLKQNIFKMPKA